MHDWRHVASYEAGGATIRVDWCQLCGCLRTMRCCDGFGDTPVVTFPYAYQRVSKTTCAEARERRDSDATRGHSVRRTRAELDRGEVHVGSRATPIPTAPAGGGRGE